MLRAAVLRLPFLGLLVLSAFAGAFLLTALAPGDAAHGSLVQGRAAYERERVRLGLDQSVSERFLNRLRRELGLTFIIVSHDLAVVSYMCERLMVMRNAETVEVLTRDQLRSGSIADPYTSALVAAS